MEPSHDPDPSRTAELDRLVEAQLRAEHDGDIDAIVAPMADCIVLDLVGVAGGLVYGREAVRRRYHDLLAATVHETDTPVRRLYGRDFVLEEHIWSGRLTGRRFDREARGRRLSHRVFWLLEVQDGQIVRQTVWNDLSATGRPLP